jgi:hypothetical protein
MAWLSHPIMPLEIPVQAFRLGGVLTLERLHGENSPTRPSRTGGRRGASTSRGLHFREVHAPLSMTGLSGGKNPQRATVVESHSCAKDAEEWGTRATSSPRSREDSDRASVSTRQFVVS